MITAEVLFRRATPSDTAAIADLMSRFIDCAWTEDQIAYEIGNASAVFFVAESAGSVVGFLSGVCAADECEISDIAVEPCYRRKGIAASLFERLFESAANMGAKAAYLLVRDGNIAAESLYRSLGFAVIGRRKGYYGSSDAVIMRRDL